MQWAARISIFRRLFWASVIVAILPGLIIFLLGEVVYIQTFNDRSQAVQVSTDSVKLAATQLANLQQLNSDLIALHAEKVVTRNVSGTPNEDIQTLERNLKNEITTLQASFGRGLDTYRQQYLIAASTNMASVRNLLSGDSDFASISSDQQQTLNTIADQEWRDYMQAQQQSLQLLDSSASDSQLQAAMKTVNSKYTPLERDWNHVVAVAETVGDRVAEVGPDQLKPLWMATGVAGLGILLIVIIVGYSVNLTIARPLRQLALLTRRIGQGDTQARARVEGGDEIALVASSMNTMLDSIVRLIQETRAQREALQSWIDKLAIEVSGVAGGNLRVQAEVTNTPIGVLAEFFNYMVRELSALVVRVTVATRAVEHSTSLILQHLFQLSKTSDVQLQQISEAKVELNRMADSNRQVAERIHYMAGTSNEAQSIIDRGRNAVNQANEGMQRMHRLVQETTGRVAMLDDHSQEINNILDVILNIAQQTNALAHNAASQAEKAGANGKGFGAVAADIQRLAERARTQVGSVASIVQTVRRDIRQASLAMHETERECFEGAKLTHDASRSLEFIFSSIERQAGEITSINQTTMHQLQAFSAVEHTVRSIADSARQVNKQAHEAARQLDSLAQLVKELRSSVGVFKLREQDSGATTPLTSGTMSL